MIDINDLEYGRQYHIQIPANTAISTSYNGWIDCSKIFMFPQLLNLSMIDQLMAKCDSGLGFGVTNYKALLQLGHCGYGDEPNNDGRAIDLNGILLTQQNLLRFDFIYAGHSGNIQAWLPYISKASLHILRQKQPDNTNQRQETLTTAKASIRAVKNVNYFGSATKIVYEDYVDDYLENNI